MIENKELIYFITCVQCGSLTAAAEKLYTTQPNVSQIIRKLEAELGCQLFVRKSRGIQLTDFGKEAYQRSLKIIKSVRSLEEMEHKTRYRTLYLATFQSNSLTKLVVEYHNRNKDIHIEYRQGHVEEIISWVEQGISELGILFVSQSLLTPFHNILHHKHLTFEAIAVRKACLYAGPCSPLYNRKEINISELRNQTYVGSLTDYFEIQSSIQNLDFDTLSESALKTLIKTNSEHLTNNLLYNSDITILGIDFDYGISEQDQRIHHVAIGGDTSDLVLGAVYEENHTLSQTASMYLESVKHCFDTDTR